MLMRTRRFKTTKHEICRCRVTNFTWIINCVPITAYIYLISIISIASILCSDDFSTILGSDVTDWNATVFDKQVRKGRNIAIIVMLYFFLGESSWSPPSIKIELQLDNARFLAKLKFWTEGQRKIRALPSYYIYRYRHQHCCYYYCCCYSGGGSVKVRGGRSIHD